MLLSPCAHARSVERGRCSIMHLMQILAFILEMRAILHIMYLSDAHTKMDEN